MMDTLSHTEIADSFSLEQACCSTNYLNNLKTVVNTHQNHSARIFGKSLIYFLIGNSKEMLRCFDQLITENPQISLLYRRAGELLVHEEEHALAIEYLEKALELNEHDLTSRMWLSYCLVKDGKTTEAEKQFNVIKDHILYLNLDKTNWLRNVE